MAQRPSISIRFAGALLAAVAAGGVVAPAARAESRVHVKLATLAPKGSIYHRVMQNIAEAIRTAEGPGATVTIYTDGSQGGEADVVRRMRVGQLNASMMSAVGLSEVDSSVSVLQKMPLVFRSTAEIEYVGATLRPQMERNLLARGFVAVLWAEAGWVRFFSKEPVTLPSDLKTRRVFAWSGDEPQVEIMKQLGYHPIVLETADIIPGLQTGLVDTVPLTAMWALAAQVDAIAPYMVDLKWATISGALVFSRELWDSMSPATQAAVRTAAALAAGELQRYQEHADDDAVAAMQKRGLKVQRLTAEQQHAWQAFAEQTYPLLRGHTLPAAQFDEALRLVATFRAQQPGR